LYYNKPRTVKNLKTALEKLDFSKYTEKTRVLAEAMKNIIESLISGK
jgi:HD superfamily phosphodiesterase